MKEAISGENDGAQAAREPCCSDAASVSAGGLRGLLRTAATLGFCRALRTSSLKWSGTNPSYFEAFRLLMELPEVRALQRLLPHTSARLSAGAVRRFSCAAAMLRASLPQPAGGAAAVTRSGGCRRRRAVVARVESSEENTLKRGLRGGVFHETLGTSFQYIMASH